MDEDTLQPCSRGDFVLPELVAVGTAPATHGRHGVLHRHVVGGLYLYAYGGYVDVSAVEEQPNG